MKKSATWEFLYPARSPGRSNADRFGAEVDRGPAARPVRNADQERRISGKTGYKVNLFEVRLEDIAPAEPLQAHGRKTIQSIQVVSEFNQRAYELFCRPVA